MVVILICFVLISVIANNAHAEEELQKATIQLTINAISSKCAEVSGMKEEQLQTAIQDKDIHQISACFFKCYLTHYGLIRQEADREIVNVPVTLIFVKVYIPEISFIDLLSVGAEVMICAIEFEKNTLSNHEPGCFKTNGLINCLAKRKMLIKALWLATRS